MSQPLPSNEAAFSAPELEAALGVPVRGSAVRGVVTDSRFVQAGQLFVALRGEKFDGHRYLAAAAAAGARVLGETGSIPDPWTGPEAPIAVADSLLALGHLARFHRDRCPIPMVAVTGSYGKTTTRALIHAALAASFATHTSQGNFNNEVGLPLTLLQLEPAHRAAVVEMGMRGPGQIAYLAQIARPNIAVITNIGPQHIELLGTQEAIAAAKGELLDHLQANEPDGIALLPADSPHLEFLRSRFNGRTFTFGTDPAADYQCTQVETGATGNIRFSLRYGGQIIPVKLPLPGAHNALNATAALAVAHVLGLELECTARALENAMVPGARMRVLRPANGLIIIDDSYNAGPDSMRAALHTLLDFPGGGRRLAVLGAMRELGDHSEYQHRAIGEQAGQFLDGLIGVCGETRPLLNSALASATRVENALQAGYAETAAAALDMLPGWAQAGDVVLVKGSRSVGLEAVVHALEAAEF